MNVGELINKLTEKLSECGICWQSVIGGRQDYLNLIKEIKPDENGNCCALLGVLNIRTKNNFIINEYGVQKNYRSWEIKLFAGIPSRLDIQFYNEVDPEKTDESKWVKYVYPIDCCIENLPTLLCDIHNCNNANQIEIVKFDKELKLNYLDINADGWLIDATFRQYDNS